MQFENFQKRSFQIEMNISICVSRKRWNWVPDHVTSRWYKNNKTTRGIEGNLERAIGKDDKRVLNRCSFAFDFSVCFYFDHIQIQTDNEYDRKPHPTSLMHALVLVLFSCLLSNNGKSAFK